ARDRFPREAVKSRGWIAIPRSLRSLRMTCEGLKPNRDTGRREQGKLRDRLPRRRAPGVVEYVEEHVLCVVRVHDAEVRRDRHSPHAKTARHVDVEPLRRGETRAVARAADELRLAAAATRAVGIGARIVDTTDELTDDIGVGRARG